MPAPVAVQLAQLILVVLAAVAFVRALTPQGGASEPQFRRRRAEWLTVALGLITVYLVLITVRALIGRDGVNPAGMLPYLALCAHLAITLPLLRGVWRRALTSAQESIPPETERPPSRHTGLSGQDTPPTRW